jgi:simple sugar transport system permease protein
MKISIFRLIKKFHLPLLFIAINLFFIIFIPNVFLSSKNLISMGKLIPDLGIVTLGIGLLMIAGEFDLSISSIIPLCSYIFAIILAQQEINPLLVLIILLPIGASIGFINGIILVKTGLPSFIITLSTMMFWKGFVFTISGMEAIRIIKYTEHHTFFKNMLTGRIFGIPAQFLWFIAIAIILGLFLHFHKFGNWVFSIGNNEQAAKAMGINTGMVKIILYMIIGALCAFSGVMQSVRIDTFSTNQGTGIELLAIAAAVLGGTSLNGGVGNLLNIFLGVLTIKILSNGLILIGAPVFGIDAFIGGAIIFFAWLNYFFRRTALKTNN